MMRTTTGPTYDDFPEPVKAAVMALIFHPAELNAEDFADLARGKIGRLCGSNAANPDARLYQLALLAACIGRGF